MPQTVEVRFKGTRRDFFLWTDEQDPLRLKEAVVVEAERGLDFGRVLFGGRGGAEEMRRRLQRVRGGRHGPSAMRPVVRRASQEEVRTANELRQNEEEARRKVIDKVRQHSLEMKVSDAEWQWDRGKLTIFFTAEKRVDFRALVRDLAAQFRTRIELRQIGVRDEAARLKGVGRCGREYCCSTWLTELSPVSLALAKDQHLSLNPAQISGGCGRLLCCLEVRARVLRRLAQAIPPRGENASDCPRPGEGGGGRHLPGAGLPPPRRAGLAHYPAGAAPGRNGGGPHRDGHHRSASGARLRLLLQPLPPGVRASFVSGPRGAGKRSPTAAPAAWPQRPWRGASEGPESPPTES